MIQVEESPIERRDLNSYRIKFQNLAFERSILLRMALLNLPLAGKMTSRQLVVRLISAVDFGPDFPSSLPQYTTKQALEAFPPIEFLGGQASFPPSFDYRSSSSKCSSCPILRESRVNPERANTHWSCIRLPQNYIYLRNIGILTAS